MGNGARWPHDAILHAWWVEPDRLLAGEYPGATRAREGAPEGASTCRCGRRLDHRSDDTPRRARAVQRCTAASGQGGRTPGPSLRPPHSGHERDRPRWLRRDSCSHPRRNQCWESRIRPLLGGKGRTSTVVGCLLIDDGLGYEAALARIAELRAGTRKAGEACPESPAQHRLLRERAARRRRT